VNLGPAWQSKGGLHAQVERNEFDLGAVLIERDKLQRLYYRNLQHSKIAG
jgi:hypothetical protein